MTSTTGTILNDSIGIYAELKGKKMRKVVRDNILNKLLARRGYIQHPLLSESEVDYLLGKVRKVFPENDISLRQDITHRSYITNSYVDNSDEIRAIGPEVIQHILAPHIETLLEDYRILYCGLFVKAPRDGWLDIHYHPTVVEDLGSWVIDIWCPLLDTDLSNGTLCVVPQSHKIFPEVIDYPYDTTLFCRDYKQTIRENYSVALPSKAGNAVIFEDSVLHWSPLNMSDSARYAVHCTCIPKEATAVYVHFDSKAPQQFEIYEGTDTFFEKDFGKLVPRPNDLRLLKIIPNQNRPYDIHEFQERLSNATQYRRELYPDSCHVSDEEYASLLQAEKEYGSGIHEPLPITKELATEPKLRGFGSMKAIEPEQVIHSEPKKRTSILSRIIARKNSLAEKIRTLSTKHNPQNVVRDVRNPINQHKVSDVKQYYEEMTEGYTLGFGEVFQGSRPSSTEELLEYLTQAANLADGLSVLDAGCGVCGPSISFAERFNLKIEALTLADVQVDEAWKRIKAKGLEDRIHVRQGDFHHLSQLYPAESFDRILFLESLCHAEDYRRVLEQAKKVLKPGGFLYIKDFHAIDYRSRPELQELHENDLRELNRIYCLVMPYLTDMVDVLNELGFQIYYIRKPLFTHSDEVWGNFMRLTNTFWDRKSGPAIRAVEFLAYKPLD